MTTDSTIKTTTLKGPVVRKRTLFPLLGAALLMTCLVVGLAQAADTGNVLNENNNNLVTGIALASEQPLDSAGSGDAASCGEYRIRCILNNGKMDWTTQPCYWSFGTFECERGGNPMKACEDDFGKGNVKAAVKESYCHFIP